MTLSTPFNAFRIHNDAAGYRSGIESIVLDALNPGEVVIKTTYSSVNYKDALAGTGEGKILRRFPLVGGIDVAGHVVASTHPAFKEGDAVRFAFLVPAALGGDGGAPHRPRVKGGLRRARHGLRPQRDP